MLGRIPLTYYALSGLFNSVTLLALLLFVFFKNPKSRTNQTFSLWLFTVVGWCLCYFLWLNAGKTYLAEFYLRTLMVFVIFIPSTFTHFILTLTKADSNKKIILGNYLISVFLGATAYTKLFAGDIGPFLVFPYWLKPRFLFGIHSIHFFANVIYAHFLMIRIIKNRVGIFRNQVLYVFVGTAIGYSAGAINYLTWYRIPVAPFLNPLVSIFVAFAGYAIYKYRLMDINIVIGKGLTYLFSLILVCSEMWALLLIINIFYHNIFMPKEILIILFLTSIIYTTCIVLYPKFLGKLETGIREFLYKDRYKYQEKLKEVASNIPTIYDMERILKYTLDTTTNAFESSPSSIMLLDEITKSYTVKYDIGLPEELSKRITFHPDTEIVQKLRWGDRILIKEEFPENNPVRERMEAIKAEVSVPIVRKDKLLGIINLNHKGNGDIYSHEDLSLLSDISKYLGMAIENIALSKREHQEELITYLNNIAYALAHELKNKSQTIVTTAQGILSVLPQVTNVPQELLTLAKMASDNSNEINSLVNELVAYSNVQQREGYGPLDIAEALDKSLSITGGEIDLRKIKVLRNYGESRISHGDWGQLIQVFVGVIRNGLEAMDEGGLLTLKVSSKNETWEISIEDTGKGIPKNHLGSIFEPFFTTKHDHSGLGLSIARRIIYDHAGEINVESTEGKGTIVYIYLPKQMSEDKLKARAEIKRREDISYDRIKTKDYQDKQRKESQNG